MLNRCRFLYKWYNAEAISTYKNYASMGRYSDMIIYTYNRSGCDALGRAGSTGAYIYVCMYDSHAWVVYCSDLSLPSLRFRWRGNEGNACDAIISGGSDMRLGEERRAARELPGWFMRRGTTSALKNWTQREERQLPIEYSNECLLTIPRYHLSTRRGRDLPRL